MTTEDTPLGDADGERRHALVAGGGSGGHVFPGVALAAELVRRGWRVSFAGRAGSVEERLAKQAGLPFHALQAAPVLGASVMRQFASLLTILRASLAGRRLVKATGVDVVVGLGGYVSVPAVVGARLARRPILLFEPNAAAGSANRWLSRFADGAAAAYASTTAAFRCPSTVTGTPVRAEFFSQPREPRRSGVLLVLGGSQGARQLNEMVPRALSELGDTVARLSVLHQCGHGNVESTEAAYDSVSAGIADVEITPFLDDVASALGGASLVISRAGAVTLAEICAVGRPAVLVPLAIAAAHQAENAAALVEAGAAQMLAADGQASDLARLLRGLFGESGRLTEMGRAARGLGRPDAVEQLASRVIDLVEAA